MKQIIEDSFKEYNNESRQFLQKIWEEFDENKDGVLDKNECLRLTTECLNAQIQYVPGHIGQSVGKMLEVMAEKHNASDEVRRSIKARVSQTKVRLCLDIHAHVSCVPR